MAKATFWARRVGLTKALLRPQDVAHQEAKYIGIFHNYQKGILVLMKYCTYKPIKGRGRPKKRERTSVARTLENTQVFTYFGANGLRSAHSDDAFDIQESWTLFRTTYANVHVCNVASCLVVLHSQDMHNKIVLVSLHFIAYSHLICSIIIIHLMFVVKVQNVKIFYFCVSIFLMHICIV